jgi:hypothetical protein
LRKKKEYTVQKPDIPLPPPAPLLRDEFLHKMFANAIRTLKELMTKPSSKFIQAAGSLED